MAAPRQRRQQQHCCLFAAAAAASSAAVQFGQLPVAWLPAMARSSARSGRSLRSSRRTSLALAGLSTRAPCCCTARTLPRQQPALTALKVSHTAAAGTAANTSADFGAATGAELQLWQRGLRSLLQWRKLGRCACADSNTGCKRCIDGSSCKSCYRLCSFASNPLRQRRCLTTFSGSVRKLHTLRPPPLLMKLRYANI